jgi:hypothetical protein
MATIRLVFAAQEDNARLPLRANEGPGDVATVKERDISPFIFGPGKSASSIGIECVVLWCEKRQFHVFRSAEPGEEIGEVILLGEARKLRSIAQTDVAQSAYPAGRYPAEE